VELDLDPELVARVRIAGLLHDVGKIGISESILLKPGPLTDEEFEVMKTHPALGHGILLRGAPRRGKVDPPPPRADRWARLSGWRL
jgi:HD-GYP domain-containing protein (c-di-GMP phosphodiesterase class II)